MPWKPRVKVSLIKCGTCGKSYSNPLTHVCMKGFTAAQKRQLKASGATNRRQPVRKPAAKRSRKGK